MYSTSLTPVHTFTPTLLSELLKTANRNSNHQGSLADQTPRATQLGLPNPFGPTGLPTICAGDFCFDSDNRRDHRHLTPEIPSLWRIDQAAAARIPFFVDLRQDNQGQYSVFVENLKAIAAAAQKAGVMIVI